MKGAILPKPFTVDIIIVHTIVQYMYVTITFPLPKSWIKNINWLVRKWQGVIYAWISIVGSWYANTKCAVFCAMDHMWHFRKHKFIHEKPAEYWVSLHRKLHSQKCHIWSFIFHIWNFIHKKFSSGPLFQICWYLGMNLFVQKYHKWSIAILR